MKNKNLVIAVVALIAIIAGVVFLSKSSAPKKSAPAPVTVAAAAKPAVKSPALKAISKDMGALTVRVMGPKNKELSLRVRAFKAIDGRSGVYVTGLTTGRMQELLPGDYDLEIDAVPQILYKGVRVTRGRETVEDIGRLTGSLEVKMVNSKNKIAYYPVRVLHAGTNTMVANITTNKPVQLVKGVYDLEIGTLPKQIQKNAAIDPDKDVVLDLGPTVGSLAVIVVDGDKKEARYPTRVRRSDTGDVITSGVSNRSIELLQGVYDIEVLANPIQIKKGVKVEAGAEAGAEFLVQAPVKPAAKAQAVQPVQAPAPAVPAKK